jgi:uncharacterized membrane protein
MAFCPKCGTEVAQGAAFCSSCGTPLPGTVSPQPAVTGTGQLSENTAAALSYVLLWLSGLVFYLLDKRPFVRFHAAQSIVIFGALHILSFTVTAIFGGSFSFTINRLIDLAAFVFWILLMIKAYQGEKFRVPLAADVAENLFGAR